ncbi:hypothetical protein I316_02751 [Kwoniella heveanensis BCC8398]|uniref:DUF1746 domain-containing protein n=1 Tax=Kwoniella heveanensis BCC8398 TaxID=1296120 RepID=A0A1B9GXE1_9TREE|nr:hypothetical protein I316_02751 [Kwoniella heveanensis BCC8398]
MVLLYAVQRRHAVAQIATTAQAIALIQHFYSPNILVLLARLLAQIQINACAFIHPTKSLFGLTSVLSFMNLAVGLLHVLDFWGGMNGGKGLILDFVGQANPASLRRVLLLDVLLYVLQLVGLCVSYVTHATQLPSTAALPYDDLLLPPQDEQNGPETIIFDDDEDEVDLEQGGLGVNGRTRKRKGLAYQQVQGDEPERELWLDDDEGPSGSGSSSRIRIAEPPLIFSLPLRHITNLVFRLPAPLPPPRAFSGGTPQPTPPVTPPAPPAATMPSEDVLADNSAQVRREGLGVRGTDAGSGSVGRIPGEYRAEGNGG